MFESETEAKIYLHCYVIKISWVIICMFRSGVRPLSSNSSFIEQKIELHLKFNVNRIIVWSCFNRKWLLFQNV